ncbi:MAG: 16S rRNA (guanine(527)-N(7))-methyltransferase RsmG [Syntrophaceae bacterium]
MINNFREILLKAAREMGLEMTEGQIALFETYRETLLLWSGRMNLVSLQSELDLPVRHFIDSLTLLPYLAAGPATLLDIGSGAGFPAIPVKIFRKDLHVTLLEASRKKCSFLKEVIRRLGLRDVAVLNCRLEELLKQDPRPAYDWIVSRATLKLPELVELGIPLLKPGGILAAMKGPGFEAETEELNSSESKNFRLVGNYSFRLPVTGDQRHIILVDKPR